MAWDFDGTTDYFEFGDLTATRNLTTFTLAGWINMDTTTADGALMSKLNSGNDQGWMIWFDDTGFSSGRTNTFSWVVRETTAGNDDATIEGATNAATVDTWQHVCGTFLAANGSGLRLYVDGIEDANSPVSTNNVAENGDTNQTPWIGASPEATRDIDGRLAEVSCWNRILSAAEVAGLAKGYSALFLPNGLVFHTPMIRQDPIRDIIGGTASTKNGTPSVFAHPPIIYPAMPYRFTAPVVAAIDFSGIDQLRQSGGMIGAQWL